MDYSYKKNSLGNGLTLVEVSQPHLHQGSISVFFKNGSRYETSRDNGLSHFLEHMIFRGTEDYPTAYDLNLAVEKLGGALFAATAPDSTEYEMTLPSQNLEAGVRLLAQVVTKPRFGDIEIERRIILEEIHEDLDEQGNPIDPDFLSRSRIWPGHPLGQSVIGTLENALTFQSDDILSHFNRHYIAENAVFCVSGAFDRDTLLPTIEQEFSRIPSRPSQLTEEPPTLGTGPTTLHVHRPGSQTQVRIAFHAFGGRDPDQIALSVLLGVLDDGMSTRLHRKIVDERGLAYSVCADAEIYSDVGILNVDATTSHKNVVEIIEQIELLVAELRDVEVSEDELTKAKTRGMWGLESFLDDPHAMNSWYGEQDLHLRPMRLEERAQKIAAIESADIKRVARRIITAPNMHITTVGVLSDSVQKEVEWAALRFG